MRLLQSLPVEPAFTLQITLHKRKRLIRSGSAVSFTRSNLLTNTTFSTDILEVYVVFEVSDRGWDRQRPAGAAAGGRARRRQGAPTIIITDAGGPLLRQPTVLLAARRGAEAEFQSLTVPVAIRNALVCLGAPGSGLGGGP